MKCPKCNQPINVIGKHNQVCRYCGYRHFERVYPEMHYKVKIPNDYAWSKCTLSNVSESNNIITLDNGQKVGSVVTPQITNITIKTERKKDITRVILIPDHTLNDGYINYFASNNGSDYIKIEGFGDKVNSTKGLTRLRYGEKDTQSYYYDLRIKAVLSRSSASDTSPQFKRIIIIHNYK